MTSNSFSVSLRKCLTFPHLWFLICYFAILSASASSVILSDFPLFFFLRSLFNAYNSFCWLSLALLFHFVSLCHYHSLSAFLMHPVFLDIVGDKAADWWWHDSRECTALSDSYPCCPRQSLTVLSRMNEHTVLTRGATVSSNKTLLCSVKFYELLDLVSFQDHKKTFLRL